MGRLRTLLVLLLALAGVALAEPRLTPFLQGSDLHAPLESAALKLGGALEAEGFRLLGEYQPMAGSRVLICTREDQLDAAATTDLGGFAAVTRVALTEVGDVIQTSCFHPDWMAASCRLNRSLSSLLPALERVLGELKPFGSEKGIAASDLRTYHYMFGMPYFDDVLELAVYEDHAQALAAVEAGLKAQAGGVGELARVALPGRESVLFSVAITQGDGADAQVLETCDTGERRHTAHLPYELLVEGNRVLALHAKFRIANSFPDLSMGTFMKIVKAPGAIEDALEAVANPR